MKKFISVSLAALMCTGCISASANNINITSSPSKGAYITNNTIAFQQANTYDVLSAEDVDNTTLLSYSNVLVDKDCMTSELSDAITAAYDASSRIVFVGDISINDARSYLGLDPLSVSDSNPEPHTTSDNVDTKNMVNVSEYPSVGKMVYKDHRGIDVTDIKVEDSTNSDLVNKAISRCLEYDYLYLSTGKKPSEISTQAGDYTNSWRNVNTLTKSYTLGNDYGTVNVSIQVNKNTGNPNTAGQYLFYVPYKAEISMTKGYYAENATVEVGGSASSKIYDYAPTNTSCGSGASISFGLPYSVSLNLEPISGVQITKESGGIDSNTVKVKYQPKSLANINAVTSNMRCEAHIETYGKNSLAYGKGQFKVQVGEYRQTITTYYSNWDSVSG